MSWIADARPVRGRLRAHVWAHALSALAVAALLAGAVAERAAAAVPSPAWNIESLAYPSDFNVHDTIECETLPRSEAFEACDTYQVTATNVGAAALYSNKAKGSIPIVLTDVLPPGVTVRGVALFVEGISEHPSEVVEGISIHANEDLAELEPEPTRRPGVKICSLGTPIRCEVPKSFIESKLQQEKGALPQDAAFKMLVSVTVNEPASPKVLENEAKVSGGIPVIEGDPVPAEESVKRKNTLEEGAALFGPAVFDAPFVGLDGQPDTQAGSHPYELLTRIGLNSVFRETPEAQLGDTSVQDLRDVVVDLPPGFAGSGVMAPTCTLAQLASKGAEKKPGENRQGKSGCPRDTIVGHIRSYPESLAAALGPVYNVLPEKGYAAELGFIDPTGGTHVLYVTLAPTAAGYVVRTTTHEIPALHINEALVSVFGDPAARDASGGAKVPTFTNPEHCNEETEEPLPFMIHMDSWQAPGRHNADGTPDFSDPNWVAKSTDLPPVKGCEALTGLFRPSLKAELTSRQTDSPTGLNVDLEVPQTSGVSTLATPPVRDTTIVLPPGIAVDPSSANGLEACSLEQIGIGADGLPDAAPPHCPDGSKVGAVTLETPSLAMEVCKRSNVPLQDCPSEEIVKAPLKGSIYLARQGENPFKSLIAIYIVIDDPRTGVVVKIPAEVKLDANTGQLTTTVKDTPQFPFSILHTEFFKGATAALTTPPACGSYTLTSELTPWSAPQSGPAATPTAPLAVNEGSSGGPCASPGFSPAFSAGTEDPHAGAYSHLNVTFSRHDGEQQIADTAVTTAPGLLGTIRGIPLCGEAEASNGTCGEGSLLGEATVAVGAGPHPFWVRGGKVYLTGPYNNGPFGLSIVLPTTAGPFTLTGNAGFGKEVVRASIRVDPHTAQIEVVSDPFPPILEGIPLEVRTVNIAIDRKNFTFNPTNCGALASQATFTSRQGATATVSSPYYASHCTSLAFQPSITATSEAQASKNNGASLKVDVTATPGQANVAKTDLTLPAQLPSRVSTLQKACVAAVFAANPASCSPESNIGTATVDTPVLNKPLSGPIYLVSFGAQEFPHTEIVLQGEGVTTMLDGHTDIKKGITYSNFESVPDVPFTRFEANLPTGPHSILGANLPEALHYDLCGTHYTIPTLIGGQNGLVLHKTTPLQITGCPAHAAIRGTTVQRRRVVLLVYTPLAGTLRIAGRGVRSMTLHTKQESNQTIVLRLTSRHPRATTLTLTQRSPGHPAQKTAARVRL